MAEAPRRHLIFFDGSHLSRDSGSSLSRMADLAEGFDGQIVQYEAGLRAPWEGGGSVRPRLDTGGAGFRRRAHEALRSFLGRYRPGDRALVFGFGIGARAALDFTRRIGRGSPRLGTPVPVDFLGLFDALAAETLGLQWLARPRPLAPTVGAVLHLMAEAETRLALRPLRLHRSVFRRLRPAWELQIPKARHEDVGGTRPGHVADLALSKMIRAATEAGARFRPHRPALLRRDSDDAGRGELDPWHLQWPRDPFRDDGRPARSYVEGLTPE